VVLKRQSLPVSSLGARQRASSPVKKRWLVHVLARLVIAASYTSSAAALEVRVDRSKSPFISAQLLGVTDVEIASTSKQGHQTVRPPEPLDTRRLARYTQHDA
jgi:hypothetical protein